MRFLQSKTTGTIVILLILVGVGTADAVFVEKDTSVLALLRQRLQTASNTSGSQQTSSAPSVVAQSSSSVQSAPPGTVRKNPEPDVLFTVRNAGFTTSQVQEPLFLPQVIPTQESRVEAILLLKDNDRAGVLAWAQSPKVKIYFLALKDALHAFFTPQIKDLVDEIQRREGFPQRNFLSFLDPGISQERIVFVRVRSRIYEMRIAEGKEDEMFRLIDSLTQ